ncbi:MAG: hypothetical protein FJZ13_03060 [Candidatus Omnitrophica bacterium]|nr:hypothetical protein [Candidatus Omnitrophota bacterium]
MDNRVKVILFGLIAILGASLYIAFQNYSAKEILQKEKERLVEENASLTGRVNKLEDTLRDNEGRVGSLSGQLDRVSQENADLKKKYDLAKKSQEELEEKLKARQAEAQPSAPPTTDAYWAGILKAKTDLELQLGNIRGDLKSVQANNEQLLRDKSTLELDMGNLTRDNEDLKRQLEYKQRVMDGIAQELVVEKNDKVKIQSSLKLLKNENALLTRQLKSLNSRRTELEKKFQEVQKDRAGLERRIGDVETMLTDKISKINELKEQLDAIRDRRTTAVMPQEKESVELPPIVVRPQAGDAVTSEAQIASPLAGKVLAINKDNNFVIIDLGEDRGLTVGSAFKVYEDGEPIANIEAIQVRKSIAACDIKKQTKPISVGDIVK